ncbi:MAG: hypothetical protein H6811_05610 [Phycisphaeraceae bacterium]|nr:hypothetical protein [Phycisphaeraceae bacterium]
MPADHFVNSTTVDRAVDTVRSAVGLCADLASLTADDARVLSILTPAGTEEVRAELASIAERTGVRIADHRVGEEPGLLDVGIDPAAWLEAAVDPVAGVSAAGSRLASARLSDVSGSERTRVLGRAGRLDALAYRIALETAGFQRPIIVDMRHVREPMAAARAALEAWRDLVRRM